MAAYIDEAQYYLSELCGGQYQELDSSPVAVIATRFACVYAARRAVPGLDLVLTENGFGVVSNQNISPASQARVENLLRSLRQQESFLEDKIVFGLLSTEWKDSPQAVARINSLLWCPTILRRYGVTLDGRDAYAEEYRSMEPALFRAEEHVRSLIGPEIYSALVARQRTHSSDISSPYCTIRELSRRLAANIAVNTDPHKAGIIKEQLLNQLSLHADDLPEYKNSSTCRAHRMKGYENKPEDKTFFFS